MTGPRVDLILWAPFLSSLLLPKSGPTKLYSDAGLLAISLLTTSKSQPVRRPPALLPEARDRVLAGERGQKRVNVLMLRHCV